MFKSVRSRVALIYMGLVAVIILLGVISLLNMVRISNTIDGLIVTNHNSIVRLNKMKETLWEQDMVIYAHIHGGIRDSRERIEKLDEVFLDNYNNEFDTIELPMEQRYIDDIGSNYAEYSALCKILLDYDTTDPVERVRAVSLYEAELLDRQADVEKEILNLYISNETALFARKEAASSSAKSSILMLGIIFPTAALGGYWLATLYTKRFFAPLYEITQSVKRIREGHLSSESRVSTEDEFGMLSSEFNEMTRRLREFEESAIGSLLNERSKTNSLIRSINEPLLVLDKDLNVVEMNEAFKTLFNIGDDSKGMALSMVLFHEDLLNYVSQTNGSTQSDSSAGDSIIVSASNDDLYYHVTKTSMLGIGDESIGIIVLFHNITEMKLLEKSRGDFIATISHEFKTPLTGITMGADLLSYELMGTMNSEQREIVDTIKEDSERLSVLVGEILELSRIESSKAIYDFRNCDIVQIIAVSAKQFFTQAERNGVALRLMCPGEMPLVIADFSKITWVINNLLSNAMKYTNCGDEVTVETFEGEEEVVVSVKDTGIGVPDDFVENIFEKFIPIKDYDIEVRGSGVGLAVSKEIVSAHGGRIWCESKPSGGSNFSFTLQSVSD